MATIARTVQLFKDRALSQAALSAKLVATARAERDKVVSAGQAPPSWRTFVDGHQATTEDGAQQTVLYRFDLLAQAVGFALGFCIARSPSRSGAFRRAWFVAVDGERWTDDLTTIPAGSMVWIVNPQPYARKVEVGGMKMSVPPGIVEAARQATARAYPSLSVQRVFTNLAGGQDARGGSLPYLLRQQGRDNRKDLRAGQAITYPALAIVGRT